MKQIVFLTIILFGQISLRASEGVFFTNVNSPVYNTRENIRNALMVVADLGLKVVYPCVWNKNYAFWKSKTVQNTLGTQSISAYGSRDILQEFIDEAEPLGLKVVPWFEYGLKVVLKEGKSVNSSRWTSGGRTFSSKSWLTKRKDGTVTMPFKWGVQKGFLNPNNPEVINFLTSMMDELASYKVDGVLIDDHFSMKPGFGYDKHSNDRSEALRKNGFYPSRKKLMTNSITDLLILMASTVKAADKRFILSPAGDMNFSKGRWSQDWYSVVRSGLVDELLMQVYRYNIRGFKQLVNDRNFKNSRRYCDLGVVILSGLKNNSRMDAKLISLQTQAARSKDLTPNYFYYDSLLSPAIGKETKAQRVSTISSLLKTHQENNVSPEVIGIPSSQINFDDLL
tara:strand:+ start:1888 stop:3075 length:1188 start_codon:yes stop_codon:yes gene_type:complete